MRLLLILGCFVYSNATAQNLLMNPGFEEENICTEYIKNCAPEGWISTSLWGDYYFNDPQYAFEGSHFVGLVLAPSDKPNSRNFLRSRLLCGLQRGAQYKLEFYIRSSQSVFDSIGVVFTTEDPLYQKEKLQKGRPQFFITADKRAFSTTSWQRVSIEYTALGSENFIAIGDFKTRGHSWRSAKPDLKNDFYFFIDHVVLTPLNPLEHMCTGAQNMQEEEYNFNARHKVLDKLVYVYSKNPPPVAPASKTTVQKVDTLVIPDVLFATNSYVLNPKAITLLDEFSKSIQPAVVDSIVVEGHTDSQGSGAWNKKLSLDRSIAVTRHLQQAVQLSPAAWRNRGWADMKPVADNNTPVGRKQNRRVEIYVYLRQ